MRRLKWIAAAAFLLALPLFGAGPAGIRWDDKDGKYVVEAVEIHNDNPDAVDTADSQPVKPEKIAAKRFSLKDGKLTATLKPFSWNMFRISTK